MIRAETQEAQDLFQIAVNLIRPVVGYSYDITHVGSSFHCPHFNDIDVAINAGDFGNPNRLAADIANLLKGATIDSSDEYDETILYSVKYQQFNYLIFSATGYAGMWRANEVMKLLGNYDSSKTAAELIHDKTFRVYLNRIIRDGDDVEAAERPYNRS